MAPFLLCTYNDRSEVQQGHPKYTMLTQYTQRHFKVGLGKFSKTGVATFL